MNDDVAWFLREKYKIIDFDCSTWKNKTEIHQDLKTRLDFPDYYGKNFDALNDCLSDLEITESGLVIVFRHFQCVDKENAHKMLDIFCNNSRRHMLFGERLLILIQVDDPNYQIESMGSNQISWNGAEWEDSKRTT